ncbi:ABC transporter substrate-binding protein [Phaeobacter inhibens]|uniref:substrate-binding domain-containing protein n=1 Tax=Phaeobacter inhibens TaxID=221822 RepID=UPI00276B9FFB|nr:substrate-binding domain-containing protein [Phaeobacter inhibens]GLO70900.1 ABC transporter substrate-binding protein [Phaeobacter inhibens]
MKLLKTLKSTAATIAAVACLGTVALADDSDHDWSDIDITLIVWLGADAEFFVPVRQGANDAAADQGINLDIQYGNGDTATMNNVIETAIANEVDGIALSIWDDSAFDESVCKAVDAGIEVIVLNIDDSMGNEGRGCDLSYVGQDFVGSGYAVGKRMIAELGIGEGDLVFTPVEFPEAVYAVKRHAGVAQAMAEVGATTEILGTGVDQSNALNVLTQYLIGKPETKAIVGLGVVPMSVAVQASADAGVSPGIGGFDLSPPIIDGVKSGAITAVSDQQPYSQGYMSVTQLAQSLKYGLFTADMETGRSTLLDASNVGLAEQWAGETR